MLPKSRPCVGRFTTPSPWKTPVTSVFISPSSQVGIHRLKDVEGLAKTTHTAMAQLDYKLGLSDPKAMGTVESARLLHPSAGKLRGCAGGVPDCACVDSHRDLI